MIRQMLFWFVLSFKRAGKRFFLLILLFLLPFGVWLFQNAQKEDSGKIAIALFTDGDSWNEAVAERLMEQDAGFDFYLCETREKLQEDVAAGRAECGYSFPAGLRTRLEERDYRRAIRVTKSPSTTVGELASECVFAGIFEVYGRELLEEYVTTGAAFDGIQTWDRAKLWAEVEPLYDKALSDGSTFAFAYETAGGTAMRERSVQAVFPVRGIGAVFVFVMALAAAVTAAEDEKRGLYAAVTVGRRRCMQMISIAALTGLSCVSVLSALAVSGELIRGTLWTECAALLIYGGVTVLFSSVLLFMLQNPLVLSGMIPFFILGSLICCPIFADLSVFVPILSRLRYLFLPWYYLMW